jgi:hypothetical protein
MTNVRLVLAFAALIGGVLAGVAVERLVVQLHAWRVVGVRAWAEFSRHADLGYGRVVYPFLGIGQLVLTWAAALMLVRDDVPVPALLRATAWSAAAFAFIGLSFTALAAPHMLRLRRIGDSPAELQRAFDGFYRWSKLRAMFQIASFLASIGVLVLAA